MNKDDYYKYYTQFIKNHNLEKVDTQLLKGYLDTKKRNTPIHVFHFLPKNITNKMNESIQINLENIGISKYTLVHHINSTFFINRAKIETITYNDWQGFKYESLKDHFKENNINVFLFDSVMFDIRDTDRLVSIEDKDLVIFSSKKFKRNKIILNPAEYDSNSKYEYDPDNITGFATLGTLNKDIFMKYYLNFYGSKHLLIKSFYDLGYNIINASTIVRTYLIEENPEYTQTETYIKSPIFTLFIIIPQDSTNDDILILKDLPVEETSQTEAPAIERYDEFLNKIKKHTIENEDDYIRKLSLTTLEYKLNAYASHTYKNKLNEIDAIIEKEKTRRLQEIEKELLHTSNKKETDILTLHNSKNSELVAIQNDINSKRTELEELQKEFSAVKYRVDLYEVQNIRPLDEMIVSKQEELAKLNTQFLTEKEKLDKQIEEIKHDELKHIVNIKTLESSVNDTKVKCDAIKEKIRLETNKVVEELKRERELAKLELQASVNSFAGKKNEITNKLSEEYINYTSKKQEIEKQLKEEDFQYMAKKNENVKKLQDEYTLYEQRKNEFEKKIKAEQTQYDQMIQDIQKKIKEEEEKYQSRKQDIEDKLTDEYTTLRIEKQKKLDAYRIVKQTEIEQELKKYEDESIQKSKNHLKEKQKEFDEEFIKYKKEYEAIEKSNIEKKIREELSQYYIDSSKKIDESIEKERTERVKAIYDEIKHIKLSKLRELTIWESKHRHTISQEASAYERELRGKLTTIINKEYDEGLARINKMIETQEKSIPEHIRILTLNIQKEETEKMHKTLAEKFEFMNKKYFEELDEIKMKEKQKIDGEIQLYKSSLELKIKKYEDSLKDEVQKRIEITERLEIEKAIAEREPKIDTQIEQIYKTKELVMMDRIYQKTAELNSDFQNLINEHTNKLSSKKEELTFDYQLDLESRYKQLLATFESNKNEHYKKLSVEYQKMDEEMKKTYNKQKEDREKEMNKELEKHREAYEKKVQEIRVELDSLYEKELNTTKKKIADEAQRMRMVVKTLQEAELSEEAKQYREMNLVKTKQECENMLDSIKQKYADRERLYEELFQKQQFEIEQSNIKKLEEERKKNKIAIDQEFIVEKQHMMGDLTNEVTHKRNQLMNELTQEINDFRKNKTESVNKELTEWVESSKKRKLEEIEESLYAIALENIQSKITAKQRELMTGI